MKKMDFIRKTALHFTLFALCSFLFMSCKDVNGNGKVDGLPSLSKDTAYVPVNYDFLKQNKNVSLPEYFPGEGWYIVTLELKNNYGVSEIQGLISTEVFYFDDSGNCYTSYTNITSDKYIKVPNYNPVTYNVFKIKISTLKERGNVVYWFKLTNSIYQAHKDVFKVKFSNLK